MTDETVTQRKSVAVAIILLLCLSASVLSGCSNNAAPPAAASSAHAGDHQAANTSTPAATQEATPAPSVPHYFEDPEKAKPFPQTLDPGKFSDPAARAAYMVARRIPDVLAQQPCYCYCDEGFGHGSLLHCHIDDHSAG